MTTVNIYLTFKGNCREAFEFYKAAFGGEFSDINTFGDMPPQEEIPPLNEDEKNQIMHVALPISTETMLMGSDTGGGWTPNFHQGNNFSVSVNTDSQQEADRLYADLSVNGEVIMPLDKTFWGSYFGMFTDQFGVNWMISAELNE